MAEIELDCVVVWGRTASTFDRAADVIYLTNYFSTKVGQGFDTGPHSARAYCAVILRKGKEPQLIADDPDVREDTVEAGKFSSAADSIAAVVTALENSNTQGEVGFVGTDFFQSNIGNN